SVSHYRLFVYLFIMPPVKRYSSGMYVKLAFAVAAHLDSEILIMDEVLAVGDMKFQEKCLNKMGDVAEHDARTVLYVSHNMNTIRKLCNRCIVLEHGQKIYDGNVEDAIKLYSNKSIELKKDYDLKTEYPGITKKIDFLSFSYCNKNGYEMSSSDMLNFDLYIKSYINSKDIHIRFILRWEDDTPVGTYLSEPIEIKKDVIHKFRIHLPLKNFPDGRYYIRITMSTVNSFGTHEDLGRCEKAAFFIVKNSSEIYYNLDWINWGWGAFLGKIKIDEYK
ncbi:MAG: ABC transporter ATP-binding protein, partial [Treponema sp.]